MSQHQINSSGPGPTVYHQNTIRTVHHYDDQPLNLLTCKWQLILQAKEYGIMEQANKTKTEERQRERSGAFIFLYLQIPSELAASQKAYHQG